MSHRTAFVTTASPLTVTIAGADTAVPALKVGSYTPTVGDRVAVDSLDQTKILVVGKVS